MDVAILLGGMLLMAALCVYHLVMRCRAEQQHRLCRADLDQIIDANLWLSESLSSSQRQVGQMWEELDTRGMEVKGLEHQLDDALEENEALRARLAGYWTMSN